MIPLASKCHGTWNSQWQPGSDPGQKKFINGPYAPPNEPWNLSIVLCEIGGAWTMDAFRCNWPCISERRRHAAVQSPISRNPSDGRWQWISGGRCWSSRAQNDGVVIRPAMHDLNLIFWWICRGVDRAGTVNEWQSGYELAICAWHIGFSGLWFRRANKGKWFFGRILWNAANWTFDAQFKKKWLQNKTHSHCHTNFYY